MYSIMKSVFAYSSVRPRRFVDQQLRFHGRGKRPFTDVAVKTTVMLKVLYQFLVAGGPEHDGSLIRLVQSDWRTLHQNASVLEHW